jgi:hypothetical protein
VSFAFSEAGALYVVSSGPAGAELLRSEDSAVSWTRTIVVPDLGVTPRVIGAREGASQPHLYVLLDYAQAAGLTTPGDRVLMSLDRGESFTSLFDAAGDLLGWSLSPDGERLAVGGHADGVQLLTNANSARAGAALTQVSTVAAHALAWGTDGQLYAAGDEAEDGFSLGVSTDEGHSFTALFALCQVNGPLACPVDTTVGALCLSSGETGWDVRREGALSTVCTPAGSAGAGGSSNVTTEPDPLVPGVGRAGSSSSGEPTSGQTSSCTIAQTRVGGGGSLLLAIFAGGAALQRRRCRAARARTQRRP